MALTRMMRALAAIVAISGASAAYAQQPAAPAATPPQPTPEPKLMFDREVYSYASNARRDPFRPLVGKESLGPLFEDLKLKGIIYSAEPTLSIVLIQDGSKRLYRLHRGEVIGNSRVVEIKPMQVRFAVENFGMVKYESLELRPNGGYASVAAPQPAKQVAAQAQTPPTSEPVAPRVDFPNDNPARSKFLIDSIAKERREKAAAPNKSDARHSATETPR